MMSSKIDSLLNICAKKVEPEILRILSLDVSAPTKEIVNYQILAGGKRIRPALAIISCQLLGGKIKDVLPAAAGLEILHNYTLIVDDIIDKSPLRRNKPTAWRKFGNSIAQCAGLDYSAAVFQAANLSKEPLLISAVFAKTIKEIIDGEILDILFEQSGRDEEPYVVKNRYLKIAEKDYFEMVGGKTASLLAACCQVGGICAGAKKTQIKFLKDFGFNLGMAFQIQDDILDIFGDREFGKKIGKDIEERKLGNIVILLSLNEFNAADKERFLKILKRDIIGDKEVKKAIGLIKKTSSRQKADFYSRKFVKKAKKNLGFLPKNKWAKIMEGAADFVVIRKK